MLQLNTMISGLWPKNLIYAACRHKQIQKYHVAAEYQDLQSVA